MTAQRDRLSKADALIVAAIETDTPALATARDLLDRFLRMLHGHNVEALEPWVADTQASLLASFGRGIRSDFAAVKAALTRPWSSGQVITKLKCVKRQIYRRAGLDLLRARLVVPV